MSAICHNGWDLARNIAGVPLTCLDKTLGTWSHHHLDSVAKEMKAQLVWIRVHEHGLASMISFEVGDTVLSSINLTTGNPLQHI